MANLYNQGQTIQSISKPVISGKILHVLQLEEKWNPVTRKPLAEPIISYTYVIISKGTGHRHDLEEKDAILI